MNLVNELENDLALAYLVNKKNAEKVDSKDVVALMNRIREVLQPVSDNDDSAIDKVLLPEQSDKTLAH